jgi:hypothetical protein
MNWHNGERPWGRVNTRHHGSVIEHWTLKKCDGLSKKDELESKLFDNIDLHELPETMLLVKN